MLGSNPTKPCPKVGTDVSADEAVKRIFEKGQQRPRTAASKRRNNLLIPHLKKMRKKMQVPWGVNKHQ